MPTPLSPPLRLQSGAALPRFALQLDPHRLQELYPSAILRPEDVLNVRQCLVKRSRAQWRILEA